MSTESGSTLGFHLFKLYTRMEHSQRLVRKWIDKHSDKIMLAIGIGLVIGAIPVTAMAQGDMDPEPIERVIQIILNDMIGGAFGALIMIVAGLVAIISAAMGAYRAGMSALVVAVGAFVLRSVVSAFWTEVNYGQ